MKNTKIVTKWQTEEMTIVGVLSQHQKHVHNTLALGSVICGVDYNFIVHLLTYQYFEGDSSMLLTNGSRLSLHVYGSPRSKMGLLFEYMHV
jgi:hypothetical protein